MENFTIDGSRAGSSLVNTCNLKNKCYLKTYFKLIILTLTKIRGRLEGLNLCIDGGGSIELKCIFKAQFFKTSLWRKNRLISFVVWVPVRVEKYQKRLKKFNFFYGIK